MNYLEFSGVEFEKYISRLFMKMGFVVEQTTYTNDGGIDMVATYEKPIFRGKYIIQCKNWQGNVGAPEIRDLYGVVMDQRANKGIIITPSDFTEQAYEFAKGKNIELINGIILRKLNSTYENENDDTPIAFMEFPETFNMDRYEYLNKKINENSRETKPYSEMKDFLLDNILNGQYEKKYSILVEKLIDVTDSAINRCCNTKSKFISRKAKLLEKSIYCMLVGRIEESLEIILDNYGLIRYVDNELPFDNRFGEGRISVYGGYRKDCLTRNLYVIFKTIGYHKGINVIEEIPKRAFTKNKFNFSRTNIDELKEECKKYFDWSNQIVYIPKIWVSDKNEVHMDVYSDRFLEIDKIKLAEGTDMLFSRLDTIFRCHGFDVQ